MHNAGRSQMAAGYLRALGGEAVEVLSAGSAPGDAVNPAAVEAMAENFSWKGPIGIGFPVSGSLKADSDST